MKSVLDPGHWNRVASTTLFRVLFRAFKPGSTGTLPNNSWADLGVNTRQGAFLRSGLNVATPVGIRPYFVCYKVWLSTDGAIWCQILSSDTLLTTGIAVRGHCAALGWRSYPTGYWRLERCTREGVTPFRPFCLSPRLGHGQRWLDLPQNGWSCLSAAHAKFHKNTRKNWGFLPQGVPNN